MTTKALPPVHCISCRVTINGNRWRIYADGSVSAGISESEARSLGFKSIKEHLDYEAGLPRLIPHSTEAKTIRNEAARLRRNRAARERTQAMKDLGLKRAKGGAFGGWE